jgi:hypothetical protein
LLGMLGPEHGMSDEEERKLWRVASEQSPDVVRWVETRLRRMEVPQAIHIPEFTNTYSSVAFIPPFGINNLDVTIPLQESDGIRHPHFHLVGMSIFSSGLNVEELISFGISLVRIHIGYTGQTLEHPASMLLVPHLDPPFKPGWITKLILPPASRIVAEITNTSFHAAQFRFAVHGSFVFPGGRADGPRN